MLDPGIKEEVKLRNDIVSVISEYVTLRRTGKNYVGLCPFHMEKTPSFTVSPDKQIFYCFGCHASGDVITFVMKKENKSFYEALKTLADRAGIDLPQAGIPQAEAGVYARRRAIYDALAQAADLYARWLREDRGAEALKYLKNRGLTDETIDRFMLGYAPDSWDEVATTLRRQGFSEEILVAAGLCLPRRQGSGVYDRFRNRAVFPILDVHGRVVGFGARSLDGREPKYINSPQTEVFSKGKGLYALNLARDAAREEGALVVVEGYMDAITAHQAGFRNVVASLGTALTQEQARQLVQISQHIIIAYDSDAAGRAATIRGLEVLRQAGASVRICEIPDGKDPDDFIRSKGAGAFSVVLKDAATIVEYFFGLYRKKFGESMAGRLRTIESLVPLIANVDNPVEISAYISMVADRTGVPEAAIRAEVQKAQKRSAAGTLGHKNVQSRNTKTDVQNMEEAASFSTRAQVQAERNILSLMVSDFECRSKCLSELTEEMFTGLNARVFSALRDGGFNEIVNISRLVELSGVEAEPLVARLAVAEIPDDRQERLRILRDCILVLKKRRLDKLLAEIQNLTPEAEGFERLFGEYQVLLREIKKSSS